MKPMFPSLIGLIWMAGVLSAEAADLISIKVGVSQQEPLVVIGRDGKTVGGVAVEVLNHMAGIKGWQIRYVPDTLQNNMRRVEQGDLDLVMPVPWPGAFSSRVDMTRKGICASWGRIYVPKSATVHALQDLAGHSIAVVRNDPHYEHLKVLLDQAGVRCEFVEMQRYGQILDAVARRQVDGGLIDATYGARFAGSYSVRESPVVTPTLDFRLVAPRNRNGALIETVDHLLSVLHSTPQSLFQESVKRWMSPPSGSKVALASFLFLALILAAGGVGFVVLRNRQAVEKRTEQLNAKNLELKKTLEDEELREKTIMIWKDWYCNLFNHSHDAILVYGLDARNQAGKYVEANATACRILGYTREELLALSPRDIESGGDSGRPAHLMLLENKGGAGALPEVVVERIFRKKSGGEIPMESTICLLSFEDRPVIVCSAHDITQRRDALQALKESERRFQDFFARSPIGVAVYNADQKLTDVNQAALAMFGFSDRAQFSRLNLFSVPDLTEESRKILLKGGTVRFEWVFNFDDEHQGAKIISSRSGRCRFDVLATNLGLDKDFNPKGFLLQIQDITERRRAEEALIQNEKILRQAQKMEAIGTLAGGIAHDFNNILTPIIGYAEMAQMVCESNSAIRSSLDEILKASHRAKDLVRQILTFSRQSENEAKPVRLGAIINEVRMLLRGSIPSNVELKFDLQTDRDIVRADPTQLHQVVMNLCTNAIHAMHDKGGLLEIGLVPVKVDGKTRGAASRLRRGDYVDLTVRDTGSGMDKQTLDRIFEPFFTTKRSGEGTGMGLAVVHGIVNSLNGTITVESEVGKGTLFHIMLPLIVQTVDAMAPASEPLPRGTETILFVDDEGDIVTMAEQMLSGLGYTPVVCRGSQEALALFRENPESIDLVITDQMMPGMTGMEMVKEMHKTRRRLPVILCTGFSRTVPEHDLAESGVGEILMKPIVLRQMAEAIRRALAGRSELSA